MRDIILQSWESASLELIFRRKCNQQLSVNVAYFHLPAPPVHVPLELWHCLRNKFQQKCFDTQ